MHPLLLRAISILLAFHVACASAVSQGTADRFPEPMSSPEFEATLDRIDLEPAVRIEALKAFEQTTGALLDLRKGAIDAYLANRPTMGTRQTREEVAARVDQRRQLLRRIANIENELFDRMQALVPDDRQVALQRERRRAERRRLWSSSTGAFGAARRPVELFDIVAEVLPDDAPGVDRLAVEAEVTATEGQVTTLLRRISELSLEEPIRFADARANQPEPTEGGLAGFEARRKLMAAVREPELEARQRLRRSLRESAGRLERLLPPEQSAALHDRFVAASAPQIATPRDPVPALVAEVTGSLEPAQAEELARIASDHASRRRDLDRRIMAALEEESRESADGGFNMVFSTGDEEDLERPVPESIRLLAARRELDDATTALLVATAPALAGAVERRAARGEQGPRVVSGNAVGGNTITIESTALELGEAGGGVFVFSSGDGEGIAMVASVQGGDFDIGATGGIGKPMSRQDLDALRTRYGIDGDASVVLDVLFEEYLGRWRDVEAAEIAELKSLPGGLGGPPIAGAAQADAASIARRFALRRAILERLLALDGEFFDSLGAALSQGVAAEEIERLRRERIRDAVRSTSRGGGSFAGPVALDASAAESADLVRVAREALLSPATRSALAGRVDEWDRAATTMLRDRFETSIVAQQRLAELDLAIAKTVVAEDAPGSRRVTREVRLSSEMPEFAKMEEVRRTIAAADRRMREFNDAACRGLLDAIADPAERVAFEDAWDRAVYPQVFRDPKSAEPMLARAANLGSLDPGQLAAIAALTAEYRGEVRRIAKEMISSQQTAVAAGPGPGAGPEPIDVRALQRRQDVGSRLRFERSELNERTLRRLKEILGEEGLAAVGG